MTDLVSVSVEPSARDVAVRPVYVGATA
jgi:hypothetical protein